MIQLKFRHKAYSVNISSENLAHTYLGTIRELIEESEFVAAGTGWFGHNVEVGRIFLTGWVLLRFT